MPNIKGDQWYYLRLTFDLLYIPFALYFPLLEYLAAKIILQELTSPKQENDSHIVYLKSGLLNPVTLFFPPNLFSINFNKSLGCYL